MIGKSLKRVPLNNRSWRSSSGNCDSLKMGKHATVNAMHSQLDTYTMLVYLYLKSKLTPFSPFDPSSFLVMVCLSFFQSSSNRSSTLLVWKLLQTLVLGGKATMGVRMGTHAALTNKLAQFLSANIFINSCCLNKSFTFNQCVWPTSSIFSLGNCIDICGIETFHSVRCLLLSHSLFFLSSTYLSRSVFFYVVSFIRKLFDTFLLLHQLT